MKTKFIALLVIIAASLTGCKDKTGDAKPEETAKAFKVTLEVSVKKDDNFAVYYTEDGSTDFTKIPVIWVPVKGNANAQEVSATLPDDSYPTQLRLDFGMKQDDDVIFKSVTLEYDGKKKVIRGAEINAYFRADGNKCTFDAATGVIKAIEKDGVKQSPSLYPQEANLGPELVKLGQ